MAIKKGEAYWAEEHLNMAQKFLRGEITEEDLVKPFIKPKRPTYIFMMRRLSQLGMHKVKEFLLKLNKKESRRLFLIEPDYLGLSYEELQVILSVSANKIKKFRYSENVTDEYGTRFVATLAMICRVPFHWLLNDDIKKTYDDDNLLYVQNKDESIKSFLNLLKNRYTRNVIGIRLTLQGDKYIPLRIESGNGQITLEVLNNFLSDGLIGEFESLIKTFSPIKGIMSTVIEGRTHIGYLIKSEDSVLAEPIYFKRQ